MKELLRKIFGQRIINYHHLFQAVLANFMYGFPSRRLHVIGVTGTDGKTTTVNLVASVLKEAGFKVSFLSTINAQIGDKKFETGLHTTTPSPFLLQELLRKMVSEGSEYAVLEVTSHALDQYRTWGIRFETAAITNVTHEHLDYHKTYEEYLTAKAKLFREAKNVSLNRGDMSDRFLSPSPKPSRPGRGKEEGQREGNPEPFLPLEGGGKVGVKTYGLNSDADIWVYNIHETLKETNFTAYTPQGESQIRLNLPGRFNVANALASICVGLSYNISLDKIAAGLAKVHGITGRMEFFEEGQNFYAMVDFAHTPNALEKLLTFLRSKKTGQLIVVFGAAGERDASKRELMGEAADKYADIIVITREDNRSEDVMDISRQIAKGIKRKKEGKEYYIIPDRRDALRFALRKAQKGDLVVITGKGHEMSLNIDGVETDWNDREVMRGELTRLLGESSRTSEA